MQTGDKRYAHFFVQGEEKEPTAALAWEAMRARAATATAASPRCDLYLAEMQVILTYRTSSVYVVVNVGKGRSETLLLHIPRFIELASS